MAETQQTQTKKLVDEGIKGGAHLRQLFFQEINAEQGTFLCKCCSTRAQKPIKAKNGPSNLVSHFMGTHSDWKQLIKDKLAEVDNSSTMVSYYDPAVSDRARNIFEWIRYVVFADQPFSIVACPHLRKITKLSPISIKTLMKHMENLHQTVERKLKAQLRGRRVGLIFDGWKCGGEHYIGCFVTYVERLHGTDYVREDFICCGVQDEIDGEDSLHFDADAYGDYFTDELQLVGLELFDNIDVIFGDNCNLNKSIANKITAAIRERRGTRDAHVVPLVGCCKSHILNLQRKEMWFDEPIVNKVNQLMIKLGTIKNRSKLRKRTNRCPHSMMEVRFGTVNKMLHAYQALAPHLEHCGFDQEVLALIPTVLEKARIQEIIKIDDKFEQASIALQRGRDHEAFVGMQAARLSFDKLIKKYPAAERYLGPRASIIHSPVFESAVVKVQTGKENTLTAPEKSSLKRFRKDAEEENEVVNDRIDEDDTASSSDEDGEDNFVDDIVARCQAQKKQRVEGDASKYRSLAHITPTSNVVERLFSRAKLIMTDHRKHMSPFHLEMLLFLRCNSRFWDAQTVQEMLALQDELET